MPKAAIIAVLSLCAVPVVKPMSPQVFNITFQEESNEAKIWIQIPYQKDYLKVKNQEFQFQIETAGEIMVQWSKKYSSEVQSHILLQDFQVFAITSDIVSPRETVVLWVVFNVKQSNE